MPVPRPFSYMCRCRLSSQNGRMKMFVLQKDIYGTISQKFSETHIKLRSTI